MPNKTQPLYSGKAKTIYQTEEPDQLIMQFRNDATAFDGTKRASLDRKGLVNNYFNAFIMQYLRDHG
ncbi:MAG: phosphoribosylaminoimidazolesuccinocarboxamide synthase, partial [Legionellales bacterium]|nr:phosphoribosylaminoimidazolesuccinocarboxamide synthase [Legionellales bacterium]